MNTHLYTQKCHEVDTEQGGVMLHLWKSRNMENKFVRSIWNNILLIIYCLTKFYCGKPVY